MAKTTFVFCFLFCIMKFFTRQISAITRKSSSLSHSPIQAPLIVPLEIQEVVKSAVTKHVICNKETNEWLRVDFACPSLKFKIVTAALAQLDKRNISNLKLANMFNVGDLLQTLSVADGANTDQVETAIMVGRYGEKTELPSNVLFIPRPKYGSNVV